MNISEKVKQLRLAKGLTLDQMGKVCNLTKGYLSKIERGLQVPPVSTLQTIAVALGIDLSDFFEPPSAADPRWPDLDMVRRKGGDRQVASRAGYAYEPLVANFKNKYMSPFLMRIPKGRTESFSHDSEEFAFVVRGKVELVYEGTVHTFEEGDSFYLDSRKSHYFVNHHTQDAVLLTVNYNYRRF